MKRKEFMENELDFLKEEAVTLLKKLIETPSISRDESKAADVIAQFMGKCGMEYGRDGNNIWSISKNYDDSLPTLLLNAHIDTVKPVAGWQRDPFAPTIENGRIYGLGSNDCGGGLVVLLQIFRLLSQKSQHYNMVYAASCEEEVSGKNGFEHLLTFLPRIDVAIVGEPTRMQPAIAEKGLMVLDVTAFGKSAHAARNEGVNAIYQALADIMWFRDFRFPKASDLLGYTKMTVTVIKAGEQHNVIPDKCNFTVDVRSNECYSNVELLEEIKKHIFSEVTARSTRLGSSFIKREHPLVQRAVALGRVPFGSPTLSDQALMPFPSLKMGPGDSSRSHTADEYIEICEIEEALDLYFKLLDGLFL